MKKMFFSIMTIAFFILSAVPAAAIDYTVDPDYQFEVMPENENIKNAVTNQVIDYFYNNPGSVILIDGGATLTKSAIEYILTKGNGEPIVFRSSEQGYTLTINPGSINKNSIVAINLYIKIDSTQNITLTKSGETIPANALLISPVIQGAFNLSFNIKIDSAKLSEYINAGYDTMQLFYISNTGTISFVKNVPFSSDGTLEIAIDKASSYYLVPKESDKGAAGNDGKDGTNGSNGTNGTNGTNGNDGINGADGNDGINGADGKDGTNGKNGADGKDGATGATGAGGLPGRDGADGADGKDGADGVDGADGKDGANGRDGIDGTDSTSGEVVYVYENENNGNEGAYDEESTTSSWWSDGGEVNPSTNTVIGVAGLSVVAGAAFVMFIARKRRKK